jgi:hypothetical protein
MTAPRPTTILFDAKTGPVTQAARQVSTEIRRVGQDVQSAKRDFEAGRITVEEYATALKHARTEARDLKLTAASTGGQGLREIESVLAQTAVVAPKATQGLGTTRSAIASLGTQAIGAQSQLGQLVSGLGLMVGGGTLALGLTAFATVAAVALDKITQHARETANAGRDAVQSLEDLAKKDDQRLAAQVAQAQQRVRDLQKTIDAGVAERATVDPGSVRAGLIDSQIARLRGELAKAQAFVLQFEGQALEQEFGKTTSALDKAIDKAEKLAQIREAVGGVLPAQFKAQADAVERELEAQYKVATSLDDQERIIRAMDGLTKSVTAQKARQRTLTDAEKLDQKLIADQIERQRKDAERILRARAPGGGKGDGDQTDSNGVPTRPSPEEEPRFSTPGGLGTSAAPRVGDLSGALADMDKALATVSHLKTEVINLEAEAGDRAVAAFEDLFGSIITGGRDAGRILENLLSQLAQLASHALFNSLFGAVIGGGLPGAPVNPGTAGMGLGFASGGVIPGTGTGDTVPAMLTPGEGVLTTREMQALGGPTGFYRLRHEIARNAFGGGVQRFAEGGVVQPVAPMGGRWAARWSTRSAAA